MSAAAPSLAAFHPLIREWFEARFRTPTDIQERAWPLIAGGRHVLLTAPTGSGKTLTAFLWPLHQLLTGAWKPGAVRALYVSPLKALNYDIEHNLRRPLAELHARFAAARKEPPEVRIATRSGDTAASERQRMVRRPPEILITTPESLNILLTSRSGRKMLGGVEMVIVDEIHAVAAGKRGTHLITAVDRLVEVAGDFQRVGVSATIRPLERIAEWFGGWELEDRGGVPTYRRRRVSVVRSAVVKKYDLEVRFPPELATGEGPREDFWPLMVADLRRVIRSHRSTLIFANSRRLTEKLTRMVNEDQPQELAYSHHGSLSREIRAVVEGRLKEGRLPAIVATNSLELGIDIGALDGVVLVQTPPSVSSAVQRVGRAGHRVGEVSRGLLVPTHGRDFVDAAVVTRCLLEQDLEPIEPVSGALDVLAQIVVAMVAHDTWPVDRLYDLLRTSEPYHRLPRRQFDLVLEMLAGRYADSRVRDLDPRIRLDRVAGTVRGRPGVARMVYLGGGTIPDRGYYNLRLEDGGAKLGELDEEFVWERSIGDTFTLGAQSWRVQRITHTDVLVQPARGAASLAPFWRAEERDRDAHLATRIGEFLEAANGRLDDPRWLEEMSASHRLTASAAAQLVDLLRRQRQATGGDLPHRHHLLVEHFSDPYGGGDRRQILLHTVWGGRLNRPLAIALAAAWDLVHPHPLEVVHDDYCINLIVPKEAEAGDVLALVTGPKRQGTLEELLRRRLETTGFFGARFRENAARALLLPRASFNKRMPLWMNRARSKKLLAAVSRYEDFPILVETWRTCLRDEFDLETLEQRLDEVARGEIRVSEAWSETPSPFADGLIWKQTNRLMYEDDTPETGGTSKLRPELLREVVFSSQLRPRLAPALVADFEAKAQRIHPGYAPRDATELVEWVDERVLLPLEEWPLLLAAYRLEASPAMAAAGDGPGAETDLPALLPARLLVVRPPGGGAALCALRRLPKLLQALGVELEDLRPEALPGAEAGTLEAVLAAAGATLREPTLEVETEDDPLEELVAEWLRCYGPVPEERPAAVFGLAPERWGATLASLVAEQRVVVDELVGPEGGGLQVCDAENLEVLLRRARAAARPSFEPLPLERLPLLIAAQQRLGLAAASVEDLQSALEPLFGRVEPAEAWERHLLPARLEPYQPAWLDGLLLDTELCWFGQGRRRLGFALGADLELFLPVAGGAESGAPSSGVSEEIEPGDEGAEEEVGDAGDDQTAEFSADAEPTVVGDPGAELSMLFPESLGRFGLADLERRTGWSVERLQRALWRQVWRGSVSADSFAPVRRAVSLRFEAAPPPSSAGSARRRRPGRGWASPRPQGGTWWKLEPPAPPADALESEELNKDRVRVLLERYGVLFRELLEREPPALRWSALFRSLRLMELSGEILGGRFFEGVPGLQFISHQAFRRLVRGLSEDRVYWLNAADPASLCGVDLPELKAQLPPRRPSHQLVYHGSRLVAVSWRNGRRLDFHVAPDDPSLPRYLDVLKNLLGREADPLKAIEIEEINDLPALQSPYLPVLGSHFSVTREATTVRLRKRYGPVAEPG